MIETFRMLGREREADLAREAQRFQLAAQAVQKRPRRSVGLESAARFRLLLLGLVSKKPGRARQRPAELSAPPPLRVEEGGGSLS